MVKWSIAQWSSGQVVSQHGLYNVHKYIITI